MGKGEGKNGDGIGTGVPAKSKKTAPGRERAYFALGPKKFRGLSGKPARARELSFTNSELVSSVQYFTIPCCGHQCATKTVGK